VPRAVAEPGNMNSGSTTVYIIENINIHLAKVKNSQENVIAVSDTSSVVGATH
jgi:hypothetical protein